MAQFNPQPTPTIRGDPLSLTPSTAIRAATYTLFYDDEFAGTAIAIGPRLVVSAGHNFKVQQFDVAKLQIVSALWRANRKPATVAYVQKDSGRDLLLIWPEEDLSFVPLRAFEPVPGCRVATVYASPSAPHRELVTSPGVVYTVTPKLCSCRGTVTTKGASGAPVIDSYGDRVLGLHLSVSDSGPDGSWVSEFVPARAIIDLLIDAKADPEVPYRVEIEEPTPAKSASKTPASKASSPKPKTPTASKSKTVNKTTTTTGPRANSKTSSAKDRSVTKTASAAKSAGKKTPAKATSPPQTKDAPSPQARKSLAAVFKRAATPSVKTPASIKAPRKSGEAATRRSTAKASPKSKATNRSSAQKKKPSPKKQR